jgi:hypothetical protein
MPPNDPIAVQLGNFFRRNGYFRRLDPVRRMREGQLYKKGAEVRLVANSARELRRIRRLLRQAGFRPARPFRKGRQWRQPLYGVEAIRRFLALIGERPIGKKPRAKTARGTSRPLKSLKPPRSPRPLKSPRLQKRGPSRAKRQSRASAGR